MRRPQLSVSNEVLYALLDIGVMGLVVAAPALGAAAFALLALSKNKKNRKSQRATWDYLRRNRLIAVERVNGKTHIRLTDAGRKKVEAYRVLKRLHSLTAGTARRRWDGKWRIVMFDVPMESRTTRDAFRHFLKRSGFAQLQKSVWLYPYDCSTEVTFLKEFFSLSDSALRLIVAESIGGNDRSFRSFFKIH